MDMDAFPAAPPETVADVLQRLSILMEQMQDRDIRLQTTISEISKERTLATDEIEALQYLDLSTQIHGDLQRFLTRLSGDVGNGSLNHETLSATLKLGSLKKGLLSCRSGGETDPETGLTMLL